MKVQKAELEQKLNKIKGVVPKRTNLSQLVNRYLLKTWGWVYEV